MHKRPQADESQGSRSLFAVLSLTEAKRSGVSVLLVHRQSRDARPGCDDGAMAMTETKARLEHGEQRPIGRIQNRKEWVLKSDGTEELRLISKTSE